MVSAGVDRTARSSGAPARGESLSARCSATARSGGAQPQALDPFTKGDKGNDCSGKRIARINSCDHRCGEPNQTDGSESAADEREETVGLQRGAPQRCADTALGDAEQRLNDERCSEKRDPDRLSGRVLAREECARGADEQVDREGKERGANRALGAALYLRRSERIARLGVEAPNEYRRCRSVDKRRSTEAEK
jgi:hypothetical protein